jgi:uncharacterized protein YbaR (Trm112 family)
LLLSHFNELRPLCPRCRIGGQVIGLALAAADEEQDGDILSGILGCSACGGEYPIIDGLPIIVTDVRRYIQDNLFYLLARDDLSPMIESLVGDAAGPASSFDSARQYLSSYVWDHWGEFDTNETRPAPGGALPGAIARGLDAAIALAGTDLCSISVAARGERFMSLPCAPDDAFWASTLDLHWPGSPVAPSSKARWTIRDDASVSSSTVAHSASR